MSSEMPAGYTLQPPVPPFITGYRIPKSILLRRSERAATNKNNTLKNNACTFLKPLLRKAEMLFEAYENEKWTSALPGNVSCSEAKMTAIFPPVLKSMKGVVDTADTCLKLKNPWSFDFVEKFDRQLKLFLSILEMVKNDKGIRKDKYTAMMGTVTDAIADLRISLNQGQANPGVELMLNVTPTADDWREVGGFISRQLVNNLRHVSKTCKKASKVGRPDRQQNSNTSRKDRRGRGGQAERTQQRAGTTFPPRTSVGSILAVNEDLNVTDKMTTNESKRMDGSKKGEKKTTRTKKGRTQTAKGQRNKPVSSVLLC